MKIQVKSKMPRKLKKWYKSNLLKFLFAKHEMGFCEYKKFEKLYFNENGE